jgi:hypothetical protein
MRLVLALSSDLVTLLAFEIALRMAGYQPWRATPMVVGMPRMSDPDPELGWVSRPGVYRYQHSKREIQVTIQADGSRGPPVRPGERGEIWFTGGSFIQGWGLDDANTLPSLIAARFPEHAVRNLAVPGYGTLQSELLYRRLTESQEGGPRLVVYGYVSFHEMRNTAAPAWLRRLRVIADENEWIELPYARWDPKNGLRSFPPRGYVKWPLSEHSALIALVQGRASALHGRSSAGEQRAVTLRLLERWQQRVERDGGEFLVMVLAVPDPELRTTLAGFDARGLTHLTCPRAPFPKPGTLLPDMHPNELANRGWAECLAGWLTTRAARLAYD